MQQDLIEPAAMLLLLVCSLVGSIGAVLRISFTTATLVRPLILLLAGGGIWAGIMQGAGAFGF